MVIKNLNNSDIILTSDVDEIPNPQILINAKNDKLIYNPNTLNRLALDMYYYNLYYRIGEGSNWHGIKLMSVYAYKTNKLTFQEMRVLEHSKFVPIIEKGGWHLSYFGDINFIITNKSYSGKTIKFIGFFIYSIFISFYRNILII
jgi:hypothetical protein